MRVAVGGCNVSPRQQGCVGPCLWDAASPPCLVCVGSTTLMCMLEDIVVPIHQHWRETLSSLPRVLWLKCCQRRLRRDGSSPQVSPCTSSPLAVSKEVQRDGAVIEKLRHRGWSSQSALCDRNNCCFISAICIMFIATLTVASSSFCGLWPISTLVHPSLLPMLSILRSVLLVSVIMRYINHTSISINNFIIIVLFIAKLWEVSVFHQPSLSLMIIPTFSYSPITF